MAYVYKPRGKTIGANTPAQKKLDVMSLLLSWSSASKEDIKDIEHDTNFKMSSQYKIFKHPDYRGKISSGSEYERLLFHGTSESCVASILETGMSLDSAKPGMFGDGIYFADRWSKSYNYTDKKYMLVYAVRDDQAVCLLDEVDRQHVLIRITKEIKNKSLKRNPMIPMIHAVRSNESDMHHFLYNDEWCVYDPSLYRMAFVIVCG